MTLTIDDFYPPTESVMDVLRLFLFAQANPKHQQNLRLCIAGVIEQLKRKYPNKPITEELVFEYLPLPKLLALCLEERQYDHGEQKLSSYLKTLPGINQKACQLGLRRKLAIKRHNNRIERGGAWKIVYLQLKKKPIH